MVGERPRSEALVLTGLIIVTLLLPAVKSGKFKYVLTADKLNLILKLINPSTWLFITSWPDSES